MRYFYDLEFLEDGKTIDIISIGVVDEDGDTYYAVNAEVSKSLNANDFGKRIADNDWLMKNVVPHLPLYSETKRYSGASSAWMPPPLDTRSTLVRPLWVIANEVREFMATGDDAVELWADYGAYDHVALMQLWGTMMAKPKPLPMYTNDIQQAASMLGMADKLPVQEGTAHNALDDAWHVKAQYDALQPYLTIGLAA